MIRKSGTAGAIAMWLVVGGIAPVVQGASTGQSPSGLAIGRAAEDGARIIQVETLGSRVRDLTVDSPAVGTVKVRLLLPLDFEGRDGTRIPLLILLHGGGGQYDDWTDETNVEAITAPTDLLVAMPAATTSNLGAGLPQEGRDGTSGPRDWETFHLVDLTQLLERNWRAGDQRAIGGLSLGGYGAVMYAARHPGLFKAVASYSGALYLTVGVGDSPEAQALVDEATQVAQAAGWDEANPINLAPSLEGTVTYISYGNGEPGPLDLPGTARDALERWIGTGNDNFVAALTEAGVPATVNAYGPGTHSWPYWERELGASLPMLVAALGESSSSPTLSLAP